MDRKNKTRFKATLPTLLVGLLMILGSVGAWGQKAAVIMNDGYFLTHNEGGTTVNPTATTSFDPSTCLWIYAARDYIRTADSNGTAINGDHFLQYTSLGLGNDWGNWYRGNNNEDVYHRTGGGNNRTYYYLRHNGTTWQINSTNSNHGRLFDVTITSQGPTDNTTAPTISILGVSNNTITLSHSDLSGTYVPQYTRYVFNGGTHNWYNETDYSNTEPSGDVSTLSPTYTWSLTANGGGVASINASTGVLTLSGAPTGNITIRLTVSNISPLNNKTIDFTLTRAAAAQSTNTESTISSFSVSPGSAALYVSESQTFTASATVDVSTYTTPAHTRLTNGGNTYYYYNGTLYTNTEDFSTPSTTTATPTFTWNMTGDGSSNASLSATSGASTTLTHSTGVTADKALTLTVEASNTGATSQSKSVQVKLLAPFVAPTITRSGNNISLSTSSLGATIYYTTDGSTPSASNGIAYTAPFSLEGLTLPVTIKAIAVRGEESTTVAEETYSTLSLESPIISISPTGAVTITCATAGASIRYTTDGTDPTSTNGTIYNGSFNVPNLTTVKAIAFKDGYTDSEVASELYVSSGVNGETVILNDYEDHNWSYYSDKPDNDYPNQLLSPDPRNVKIIYDGNGGEVSYNESENQFVYYKTIEKSNNAYTYKVIPNPFSKRPTVGTGNNRWRGFGGWKIISGGEYINGHNNNDVLSLEETLTLTNLDNGYTKNCLSATIELQATWVQAYVSTVNGTGGITSRPNTLTGSTYETNFIVILDNNAHAVSGTGRVTISNRYPDGSAGGNGTVNGCTTAADGTKIEFTNISGTFTEREGPLIVGRGCTGTVNEVTGTNANRVKNIRLESGTYSFVHPMQGLGDNAANRGTFVFGCDYDRANVTNERPYGDNTKLRIVVFTSLNSAGGHANDNTDDLQNITVKSGYYGFTSDFASWQTNKNDGWGLGIGGNTDNFNDNYTVPDENGVMRTYTYGTKPPQNTMSFYVGPTRGGGKGGKNYLRVEGGELSSINGGGTDTPDDFIRFDFRMTGGWVKGAIYGGASATDCYGSSKIVITGGEVNSWIGGGCNGTDIQAGAGATNGTIYIYAGGNAQIRSHNSDGVYNNAWGLVNHIEGGQIFGGGRGMGAPGSYSGSATKAYVVVADESFVEQNVYGGSCHGVSQDGYVYILGGTVGKKVFGGSFEPTSTNNTWQARNTYVRMYGGLVKGGIYGGNDALGTVTQDAEVIILGGQVGTDVNNPGYVFGGGYGAETRVSGNVDVNIGKATTEGGTTTYSGTAIIYGDVYGGSALGLVNGTTATNTYHTNVTLNKGIINGSIYGGGLGDASTAANVYGPVTVTVNGGSVNKTDENGANGSGAVYGCNNINGAPQRTVNVTVTNTDTPAEGNTYAVYRVFGGGNMASYTGVPEVNINGGYVGDVYGGGNKAGVGGSLVNINDGSVSDGVYGGCNTSGEVSGDILVNINGGTPGTSSAKMTSGIFGGGFGSETSTTGNVTVNVGTANGTKAPTIYGDVYGGSALGNVNSGLEDYTYVNLHAGTIHGDAYGGGLGDDTHAALVKGNVTVTQNGVEFVKGTTSDDTGNEVVTAGRIFGCNNLNGSPQGTVLVLVNRTSIEPHTEASIGTYDMQAIYGGGNLAAYDPAAATLNATTTGQFTSYSDKNGNTAPHAATGKPLQVVINGCEEVSVEYVYGGGNAAPTPSTDVLVLGAFEIGYVFGGGNGKDKYTRDGGATWNTNPGADVGIKGGATYGTGDAYTSVYGGTIHEVYGASNQKGTIKRNINLDVKEGLVNCHLAVDKIVGAGKNADVDGDCILVMGCMPSNPKTKLVFGGADNANVNGNVELTITSGSFGKVFGGNNLGGIIKGHIKVNIEETGCNPIIIDELYLGGNEAAYSRFGYYDSGTTDSYNRPIYLPRESADDTNTAIPNPAADNTHTFPYAQPVLNVISCTSIGKVFGGGLGEGAAMYADPTVNLNMIKGDYYESLPVDDNNPKMLGAVENVYGGGNEAAVHGNTKVNIGTETAVATVTEHHKITATDGKYTVEGAYVTGTVYGAGKGVATNPEAAIVTGNTQVNMAGGHIRRSIYGGGELSSVGTFKNHYTETTGNPNNSDYHVKGEPGACEDGTGLTEVIISGGQVGLVNQLMPDPANPTSDDDYGYVFCAGKGIADPTDQNEDDVPYANLLAVSGSSHLEITGGLVAASVYGGSENGQVLGNTFVEIKGGQIGSGHYKEGDTHHWDPIYTEDQWTTAINAVKKWTDNNVVTSEAEAAVNAAAALFHECDAWPFGEEGKRHVYDHFAKYEYNGEYYYDEAHQLPAYSGSKSGSDGHSYYGHVFGGGSGYYPYAAGQWRRTAGRVNGNTLVEISGGHILTNVYGGNEITDVLGSSTVHMTGGTVGVPRTIAGIQARPVNSYIFGAGMGDPRVLFNGWSNVASSEVIVEGNAVVFGSVFGGGEDGHVLGNSSTTIRGNAHIGTFGTSGVDGNIFGSGRGFSALTLTAGAICGNITVDISGNSKILGSVYGGGRLAAVGTHLVLEDHANYGVLIPDGKNQVLGEDDVDAADATHGYVTVNITGGTIGNEKLISSTNPYSVGDVFGGSKGTLMDDWAKSQKLGLVKNTTINISEASASSPTRIYGNVYGGGEIASVGSYTYYETDAEASAYNNNFTNPTEPMTKGDVKELREANTGKATISITGGTIGQSSPSDTHGHVFGGCLGRAGKGYSGYSFVNISDVTLQGGTVYGSIFGGGENGHVLDSTLVKIKSGIVGIQMDKENIEDDALDNNMVYKGNVYGGGRGIDTYHDNDSGTDTYSITAGKVAGKTRVIVEGGNVYRNVYGGGSLASVGNRDEKPQTNGSFLTGLATVVIKGGKIGSDGGASANNYETSIPDREYRRENGFVYGSGRGMSAGANSTSNLVDLAYTKNTIVSIEGTANVTGSVFGGGENGHVKNNTKVYVKGNSFVGTELNDDEHVIDDNGRGRLIYRGNVYGGGRGIDEGGDNKLSLTAGRVYGDTYVEVSGGKIYHDVFGGGSLASVGNQTIDETTGEVSYGDESGEAKVRINGGIIGYSSTAAKQGFNCGFVYGGCRGLSAEPNSDIVKMAYVHDAKVYIEDGADIKGSVFGGGANGHVKNDTYVEISGGSIGTALLADEVGFDDHGVAVKPVFRGNVYAGGRGVDLYQKDGSDRYSMTAGAVYGNAELIMTGGHVWHNVYGSGAMASVGTVLAKPAGAHVHDEIVNAGGTVVNPDSGEPTYLSGVFTDNTGKVTVTITGGTVGDTTPGHEGRNNGRVYGAGRGVSANRSDLVASMEYVKETFVTIGTESQYPSDYTGSTPGELNYPYIYGAVFGGGENGHVKNDTHVTMHSGIIGWPLDEGNSGQHKTAADGASKNPFRGHIFGGGRGVDPLYHTSTETRSSTAGRVYGHTYVNMTGGLVRRAIYGGGLLASVGVYRLAESDLHIIDMIEDEEDSGDAQINISGGIIGNVMPDGSAITGTSSNGYAYLAPGDNNGHVFGSSCGMVADNYIQGGVAVDQQYRQMGYSHSTHVNISGGHMFGSLFGSGENGHVWEDAIVNISGGEIGTEGSELIYCGNVYGSGRGVDHPHTHISETAGKVRGNTTVNMTGGIVWRDVYGGGSLASVGEADETAADSKKNITSDPTTNNPFPYSTGLTRVVIDGTSTVHGSVYGSGRGVASANEEYKQAAYVKNTLVTVKGNAHVMKNVFGGGNAGHVRKNTDVTIDESAKVDGNVYGGGAGAIESPTAGLVNHDVVINIKGGVIAKDVYGGGAIANTNVHDMRNTAVTDCGDANRGKTKTEVNLLGGIILGDAYGGGQGVIPASTATDAEKANAGAMVQGDVTVTLDGTAFYPTTTSDGVANSGRVFGCNNLNGTPQGTVLVKVLKTVGVTKSGDTYTVKEVKPTPNSNIYEVEAVYGGGNLAAYEPWDANATGQYTYSGRISPANNPLQVVIDGCEETSIDYVYGGGNAASTPSTQVTILGAYEIGTVFGGGNGKDALPNGDPNPGADVGVNGGTNYGTGDANVYLFGGTIHEAFGGSNTKGSIIGKAEMHIDEVKNSTTGEPECPLILDEAYGGGNVAYMEGGTEIDLGCITSLKTLYGGARNANVGGDINMTITSGHFDRVFGGNNLGGTISGSITVNIEETGCNPITIGELYGCGNQAPYSTPSGKTDPTINVKSFTSIGRIFGGGLGTAAVVTGNPTVNINEVKGENANNTTWDYHQKTVDGKLVGNVIEYHDNASDPTEVTSSVTMPTHETGKIGAIGTVFGGGNAAEVNGGTHVNIGTESTVTFDSIDDDETTTENEKVKNVEGVDIRGDVFGGGNQADVTGKTNVIIGQ